jgi:2-polyprenyl-3-methyl-5-hydroxy-6-metoxy-1,4-benzoquinol methylase
LTIENPKHPPASSEEARRLQNIAQNSLYSVGLAPLTIRYCFDIFARHLTGDSILELGPAEGLMTESLVTVGKRLTVVEGAGEFCDSLSRRFPQIGVVNSLFEDFNPGERWDNIILGHVLEHVEDPVAILQKAIEWLSPAGRIFASVPNARSLHRQAGVLMSMLPYEDALNDLDRHHGHRRVFNPESFRACFNQAKLKIEIFGGYFVKPISNRQIEEDWTVELIDAYLRLGERYPDIASEIYVIASR